MNHNDNLPKKLINMLSEDNYVIFLFHGVINQSNYKVRNYNGKHIQKDIFAKCIKLLKNNGNAFSMDNLIDHHSKKEKLPPKSFAITFDDGFENNFTVASPILYDFKVPATIYITTEFIEKNSMSWIDRIEFALENTHLKSIYAYWLKRKIVIKDSETKISFLNEIRSYVKNNSDCDSSIFANELCEQLGFSKIHSSNDPIDKKMSWDQVSEANKSDLLTIGGHTHTHPILSFLNNNQLSYELDTSIKLLKDKADIAPRHYSYPEGLKHCYSENVIKELKKRGVLCCPTAINGVNNLADDLFHLKRIMI